jgi:hypothetical protein
MIYVIFTLVGFIAGLVSVGFVSSVIDGLKTDLATLRTNAMIDAASIHARINTIESTIASKLP